jgi:hypothetical protein
MKKLLIGLVAIFVFAGCDKANDPPPIIQSSEKSISEVIFKKSDNPSLLKDIVATIAGDSVKAIFSKGLSLNSLIPTINFLGKTISPANKTPQNFSNAITYTVSAEDGSTKKFTFAASNRPMSDSQYMATGKWKVLKDSLYNNNFFFFETGSWHFPTPGVYIGKAADYFNFKEDGSIDVYANQNSYNKGTWSLLSNNRFSISELDVIYDPAFILELTETKLTLFWTHESTINGPGQYRRTLYLIK